jgi:hypothetical protein
MPKIYIETIKGIKYYSTRVKGKKIRASEKTFASERDFKGYIEEKGYLLGAEAYKSGRIEEGKGMARPMIHSVYAEIDSDKRIKKGNYNHFRVMGVCKYEGKTYYGMSGYILKRDIKGDLSDFEGEVYAVIAHQILNYKTHQISSSGKEHLTQQESLEFQKYYDYAANFTKIYYKYINEF